MNAYAQNTMAYFSHHFKNLIVSVISTSPQYECVINIRHGCFPNMTGMIGIRQYEVRIWGGSPFRCYVLPECHRGVLDVVHLNQSSYLIVQQLSIYDIKDLGREKLVQVSISPRHPPVMRCEDKSEALGSQPSYEFFKTYSNRLTSHDTEWRQYFTF